MRISWAKTRTHLSMSLLTWQRHTQTRTHDVFVYACVCIICSYTYMLCVPEALRTFLARNPRANHIKTTLLNMTTNDLRRRTPFPFALRRHLGRGGARLPSSSTLAAVCTTSRRPLNKSESPPQPQRFSFYAGFVLLEYAADTLHACLLA